MADLLHALCNICLNKLSTLRLRLFPPLKPFERRDDSSDIYGGYDKTAPADVALASPQTPLIPPNHPFLTGVCRRRHPYKAPLLSSFQWVSCVFACNHPPQQTHHPVAPRHPSSQAFREEGPTSRYIRRFRLYGDIQFDMYRSPCKAGISMFEQQGQRGNLPDENHKQGQRAQ